MPVPHHSSFLQAGCYSCRPTNSVKALKAKVPEILILTLTAKLTLNLTLTLILTLHPNTNPKLTLSPTYC